jgi:hypothetical protein
LTLVDDIIRRADRLKADRSTTEATWQEIRDLMYPSAPALTATESPGAKQGAKVLDNTGEQAAELLAAALYAGLTHPEQPWFAIRALGLEPGRDREADLWLEIATRRLLARFNSPLGNFAPQQDEKLMDLVNYGSGCMFIGERPGQGPLFSTRPIGECYFAEGPEGKVDTVYRQYELTAAQAVAEFGSAAGDKTAAKAADPKTMDEKVEMCHAVYPRRDRDSQRADAANMPFASVWINKTEKHPIKLDGYPEFPYSCPRWRKRAGETYGRGPGHKALADVKMLQRGMKTQIRGVEKIVDPALMLPDDGVLNTPRLGSGKLNYVRPDLMTGAGDPIRPIQTGGRPDLGEGFLESVRERIQFAFFTHLIQFARDPKMTATQFLGITEQTMRVLAPILARLQVQDAQPMIERVFAIGARSGWFPPPPESIASRELRIEYVSPITKQQNIGEARAFAQAIETMVPLSTTNPEVFDNFDLDAGARDLGVILGMRTSWIRSIEQVGEIRRARAEATRQAAGAERAERLAGAAHQGAKALAVIRGGLAANAA